MVKNMDEMQQVGKENFDAALGRHLQPVGKAAVRFDKRKKWSERG